MILDKKEADTFLNFLNLNSYWLTVIPPKTEGKTINHTTLLNATFNQKEALLQAERFNGKGLVMVNLNEHEAGSTTTASIKRVTNLVIDVDVEKKEKYVSSKEDKKEAIEIAGRIVKDLQLTDYIKADTGNGCSIFIKVDLPNNKATADFYTNINNKLAEVYSTERAKIDRSVKDLNRRYKIIGTLNRKDTAELETRKSKILEQQEAGKVEKQQQILKEYAKDLIEVETKVKVNTVDISNEFTKLVNNITKNQPTIKRLLKGNYSEKRYKSNSEAEQALINKLVHAGILDYESINNILTNYSRIGKWRTAPQQYKDITYKKALKWIQNKNLEQYTGPGETKLTELDKEYLEGDLLNELLEETNKNIKKDKIPQKGIFLAIFTQTVEGTKPTSSNILLFDESGLGKDHIAKHTLKWFDAGLEEDAKKQFTDEIVKHRTKLTPNVMTYWKNKENAPGWTWDKKILYYEEAKTSTVTETVFNAYAAGHNKATVTKDQEAEEIELNGKPVIILTSKHLKITDEMSRRYLIIPCLDTEDKITSVFYNIIKDKEEHFYDIYKIKALINLLNSNNIKVSLEELHLINIVDKLPKHRILMTHLSTFKDYIKSSCSIHRYTRNKNIKGEYIATKKDYENAEEVFNYCLDRNKWIGINKRQERLLNILSERKDEIFSYSELVKPLNCVYNTIAKDAEYLSNYNLVELSEKTVDDVHQAVKSVAYKESTLRAKIPKYEDLIK